MKWNVEKALREERRVDLLCMILALLPPWFGDSKPGRHIQNARLNGRVEKIIARQKQTKSEDLYKRTSWSSCTQLGYGSVTETTNSCNTSLWLTAINGCHQFLWTRAYLYRKSETVHIGRCVLGAELRLLILLIACTDYPPILGQHALYTSQFVNPPAECLYEQNVTFI